MQGAEIFDGDILVVDRSIRARHGHIVIAFINGERLVKRLYRRGGRVALVAENPAIRRWRSKTKWSLFGVSLSASSNVSALEPGMAVFALVDGNNFYASCEKLFNPS